MLAQVYERVCVRLNHLIPPTPPWTQDQHLWLQTFSPLTPQAPKLLAARRTIVQARALAAASSQQPSSLPSFYAVPLKQSLWQSLPAVDVLVEVLLGFSKLCLDGRIAGSCSRCCAPSNRNPLQHVRASTAQPLRSQQHDAHRHSRTHATDAAQHGGARALPEAAACLWCKGNSHRHRHRHRHRHTHTHAFEAGARRAQHSETYRRLAEGISGRPTCPESTNLNPKPSPLKPKPTCSQSIDRVLPHLKRAQSGSLAAHSPRNHVPIARAAT